MCADNFRTRTGHALIIFAREPCALIIFARARSALQYSTYFRMRALCVDYFCTRTPTNFCWESLRASAVKDSQQ